MTNQLFINNIEIDINKEIVFPITYSINDVKQPEKRKSNSSKTIVLPGTKNNNKFFAASYDLTISDVRQDSLGFDFDPTLRYPAWVLRNGKEIFRGTVNLQKVVVKKEVNSFHIVLYSETTNMFQKLGDVTVAELGWSDYDHTLSYANITASWSAPVGSGYWYPLIDFGFTDNPLQYLTNELRPYIYQAEIIEKCFEKIGLTVSSSFLANPLRQKLTWGSGGGTKINLDAASITSRRSNYSGDGSRTFQYPWNDYEGNNPVTARYLRTNGVNFKDNAFVNMTIIADPNLQFNEVTGEWVALNSGDYNLSTSCDVTTNYGFVNPAVPNQDINIELVLIVFKNEAEITRQTKSISDNATGVSVDSFAISQAMQIDAGDVVRIELKINTDSYADLDTGNHLNVVIDFNNTISMDFTAINSAIIDGDTVELARFLPKMKAKDFMKDFITMWNMYMDDPDEDGVVVFEDEANFYRATNDVDQWSDKKDNNKDIEIVPAGNIQGKVYSFRWAQDHDYYKGLYLETYGTEYGDYDYNVPSTFKTGEKVYQLKSAQTCPVQIEGTDIIIPRIIKVNETTLVTSPHKGKPRMFFNNGTVASDPWELINSDTLVSTVVNLYPVAHHLDDVTTPTFDLNFGVPQWVYYTAPAYTSNNLFSEFNSQFIRELTSRDSKLVNMYFRLTEDDLYKGFMRRLCNIDGVLYRKNIVKDFRATGNQTTKVELVKIVKGASRKVYSINIEKGDEPPLNPVGGSNDPIDADTKVASNRMFYPIDSSSKDIAVTLDADTLRKGWIGEIKKLETSGKITITPIRAAGKTSIDGFDFVIMNGKNDSLTILFDGEIFKII